MATNIQLLNVLSRVVISGKLESHFGHWMPLSDVHCFCWASTQGDVLQVVYDVDRAREMHLLQYCARAKDQHCTTTCALGAPPPYTLAHIREQGVDREPKTTQSVDLEILPGDSFSARRHFAIDSQTGSYSEDALYSVKGETRCNDEKASFEGHVQLVKETEPT